MNKITIQPFDPSQLNAVDHLQNAYSLVYPDAPVIPGEVYLSPAYEGGQNLFCAVNESGTLVGYAPLYPVLIREPSGLPHTIWTEIKVDPACDGMNEIKEQLFERLLSRTREVTRDFPGHPVHLTFQYFPSETASIAYVTSKGCEYTDSVFTMRRNLSTEILRVFPSRDICIRSWCMESEAEQQQYVRARNECFPEAPVGLEEWQYFTKSPQWSVGTTFAAFDGEELVGNVAVFWDEAENQASGRKIGFTEYIFVRPGWRGKNIARSLITAGLNHLKQRGLTEAHLEVRAKNLGALRLYTELGYEVIRESRFYVLAL